MRIEDRSFRITHISLHIVTGYEGLQWPSHWRPGFLCRPLGLYSPFFPETCLTFCQQCFESVTEDFLFFLNYTGNFVT